MLPVVWHMDGGEIHRNSEYYEFCMGSVLAQLAGADSLDSRFLVCQFSHLFPPQETDTSREIGKGR